MECPFLITVQSLFYTQFLYVYSLQQINARLNEKIVAHLNRNHQITATQASQTVDFAEHETVRTSCFSSQTDPKMTGVLAVPVRARLNAKTTKPESTHVHNAAKDDAHLMATLRGMRVDLAIKEKAMQRLTRDLEECKKTMRKLQKERDGAFGLFLNIYTYAVTAHAYLCLFFKTMSLIKMFSVYL